MDDINSWISEGLALQRGGQFLAEEDLSSIKNWTEALLRLTPNIPPLGVLADVGHILLCPSFDLSKSTTLPNVAMSKKISAYEDTFLGRILSDFRLERCREIFATLDPKLTSTAIAVFTDQIFLRLKCLFKSPSPSFLSRAFLAPNLKENQLESFAGEFDSQQESYDLIILSSRRAGSIISDADIYILENIDTLTSNSQRLAINMVADAAQQIGRHFPAQTRQKRDRGNVSTNISDESTYPIGGYSGMSTQGTLESLVGSELIYLEPDEPVDLFDIRWAGNELLKYTRDESVHRRERRAIYLFFDESLNTAKKKDYTLPFQRIILVMGGVLTGINKIIKWLDSSELNISLVFSPELKEQQKLMTLLLRGHIKNGVVSVHTGEREEYENELSDTKESSMVDVIRLQTTEFSGMVYPNDFIEYILEVQKEPLLHMEKGKWTSGNRLSDWANLFSLTFQKMV